MIRSAGIVRTLVLLLGFFLKHVIIIHRPTAEVIRKHFLFWREENQISFLIAVRAWFSNKNKEDKLLMKLNDSKVIKARWGKCIFPQTRGGTCNFH